MFNQNRDDFPTLRGDHAPAYLDNACVTLKPQSSSTRLPATTLKHQDVVGVQCIVLAQLFQNRSQKREQNSARFLMHQARMKLSLLETLHIQSTKSLTG